MKIHEPFSFPHKRKMKDSKVVHIYIFFFWSEVHFNFACCITVGIFVIPVSVYSKVGWFPQLAVYTCVWQVLLTHSWLALL